MESIKELREICQKPIKSKESAWSWYVGRRISIYFTKLFLYTNITANQISIIWPILQFVTAFAFLLQNYWLNIIAVIVLKFGHILDTVDGEVARFRKKTSLQGDYIDAMGHQLVYPTIFLMVGFGVFFKTDNLIYLAFAGSAIIGHSLLTLGRFARYEAIVKKSHRVSTIIETKKDQDEKRAKETLFQRMTRYVSQLFGNPGIPFALLITAIIGRMEYFVIFYGIIVHPAWLFRFYYEFKKGIDKLTKQLFGDD